MPSKNKVSGTNYELRVIDTLARMFGLAKYVKGVTKTKLDIEIASTRLMDQDLDNLGVDIWIRRTVTHIQRWWIQCKVREVYGKTVKTVDIMPLIRLIKARKDYAKVYKGEPEKLVAMYVKTMEKNGNAKHAARKNTGEFVVLPKNDFELLLKTWYEYNRQQDNKVQEESSS